MSGEQLYHLDMTYIIQFGIDINKQRNSFLVIWNCF